MTGAPVPAGVTAAPAAGVTGAPAAAGVSGVPTAADVTAAPAVAGGVVPPEAAPGRAHHDLGGVSRFLCERIDTGAHALTAFDREVDALRQILGAKGVMGVDELRRGIEAIPEAEYHALSYYQRWLRAITATLLRKGVVAPAALAAALSAPATAAPPPDAG